MADVKDVNLPTYEEATHTPNEVPSNKNQSNVGGATAPPLLSQHPQVPFGAIPSYGAFESIPINAQAPITVPAEIIVIGGCPACRIGILEDNFPLLGLCCAIVFFPVGILCCLALKNKRCTNCGMEF